MLRINTYDGCLIEITTDAKTEKDAHKQINVVMKRIFGADDFSAPFSFHEVKEDG